MKTKIFFFHYNKPASQRSGTSKMSIHWNNACYIVDHVICNVPCYTHHRKVQPRCVMKGKCINVTVTSKDDKLIGTIE